jgi:hypothetical protein
MASRLFSAGPWRLALLRVLAADGMGKGGIAAPFSRLRSMAVPAFRVKSGCGV